LKDHDIQVSTSRVGNCYDHAVMQSFFATLKSEGITRRFVTRDEARTIIFHYIEIGYNRQRRHSTLDYLSPTDFERRFNRDKVSVR